MPHLILEKDILEQIFIKRDQFPNVIEYFKKDLFGVNLICDYDSEDELKEAFYSNPLIEFIVDNISTITFNANLKKSILDETLFNELGEKNVFIIDINNKSVKKLEDERCYLFFNFEQLIYFDEILAKYKQTKILKVTKDNSLPSHLIFENWNSLSFCFENMNSLIIFDRYILKETTQCKLNDNILKLIDELAKSKYDITLTIISEFLDSNDFNKKYDAVYGYIEDNKYSITINLINHVKSLYPRNFEGFHSRYMLSNYFYIISTDSFNYFKPCGSIINSADLIVNFNIFHDNNILFKKEIKSITEYLAKVENNINNPSDKLKLMYKPSKFNPLLN
ncbi:hypothetical protein HX052_15325 [Myroides marinus]|uniref:hypothetical protein n=1 Tax=Myroides marinus TaxID=703342 RepID=UPI002578DC0C|nr:hypothetical protein [Myroides marinus]MDM1391319.1 hypothetical protein [Myroides marinus]